MLLWVSSAHKLQQHCTSACKFSESTTREWIGFLLKSDNYNHTLHKELAALFPDLCHVLSTAETRMLWANAQRDGRPAEYRWRPLFNAAKFGWRPILECRAVTLPRRETWLKLAGVAQTTRSISAAISGPKFTILWEHVEEILLLNKYFSNCWYVP